jgi:hypothetical protein
MATLAAKCLEPTGLIFSWRWPSRTRTVLKVFEFLAKELTRVLVYPSIAMARLRKTDCKEETPDVIERLIQDIFNIEYLAWMASLI